MFKNPFKRRSSMANEQNEQAQDIQNEQVEQSNEQTQAEGVEQANDVTVESLQAQITKLEENLKLEKARTANAVYEAQKSVERIQREYGISPRSGRPQVVCTETPTREAESEAVFDRELGKQMHHGQVAVKVAPLPRGEGTRITFAADEKAFPPAFCQAVREGVENALQSGPRTGYPLQDIAVTVTQMVRLEGKSTPVGFHMAAGMAVRQALASASVAVLEPLMQVEISVPESAMGSALSLFGARGGLVEAIEDRADLKAVRGVAPMSRLFGFSTDLRSATQGRAGLVMRFARFDIPE
ncbi:MAG: hypothetical protein J5828_05965 [Desulfovibrionaceae bacterium]|nr:hypothetical protein [Desulfovibrionaceae bacterium]